LLRFARDDGKRLKLVHMGLCSRRSPKILRSCMFTRLAQLEIYSLAGGQGRPPRPYIVIGAPRVGRGFAAFAAFAVAACSAGGQGRPPLRCHWRAPRGPWVCRVCRVCRGRAWMCRGCGCGGRVKKSLTFAASRAKMYFSFVLPGNGGTLRGRIIRENGKGYLS